MGCTPRLTGETREGGAERVRHDVPRSAAAVEWAVTSGHSVGAVDLYGRATCATTRPIAHLTVGSAAVVRADRLARLPVRSEGSP
jgi:hypothetical protein